MSVALPKLSNYGMKPTSVKATRRELSILSANKTSFSPSETAQFYLPSLPNNVMDGGSMFLRFTATITGNGFIDNSAQSFIDQIQIYGSGGSLIADIRNYAELACIMLDLQMSQSEKKLVSRLFGELKTLILPQQQEHLLHLLHQPQRKLAPLLLTLTEKVWPLLILQVIHSLFH